MVCWGKPVGGWRARAAAATSGHTLRSICVAAVLAGAVLPSRSTAWAAAGEAAATTTRLPRAKPADVGMDALQLAHIDDVMADAMARRETPGGVVLVARAGQVVFERAYGHRAVVPHRESTTLDTVYDLASLTKVVATAPAIMRLVEQGKLRLRERVTAYLPEWKYSPRERERRVAPATSPTDEGCGEKKESGLLFDRERITVAHLLLHTSGLDDPSTSFFAGLPMGNPRAALLSRIAARPLQSAPGTQVLYSDLNYILLGDIVERVAGMPLDQFATQEIFAPLTMHDTRFNPPRSLQARIAPTIWAGLQLFKAPRPGRRRMLRAEASLQNVTLLQGIAGHAGLFSTADDLSIFCQMMLRYGRHAGGRILSPLTVAAMTSDQLHATGASADDDADEPYSVGTADQRGLGWDIRSPLSTPRGDLFQGGYGHTGWSGGSVWIVPEEQLFIVILTNRIHPRGGGSPSPLRGKIANVVAASIVAAATPAARAGATKTAVRAGTADPAAAQ